MGRLGFQLRRLYYWKSVPKQDIVIKIIGTILEVLEDHLKSQDT
jgi:hypothetical protein